MKRDMDLIRTILQKVELCEDPDGLEHMPEIDGYSKPQVSYHVKLLREAGLIEAKLIDEINFILINLTWEGHEFLDAARDDSLWSKAKETFIKPGVSFTVDLILAWLKMEVKKKIGLF